MTDAQALKIGTRQLATDQEKQFAREIFQDDDVQIDDDAKATFADDAVWVQAWVRVPKYKFVRN